MKILTNQQINYCNLTRETEKGVEYLPGVIHQNKLHMKKKFFPLGQKQEALNYGRDKFLQTKGDISYILIEDSTGFTIWVEDKQAIKLDNEVDIVDTIDINDLVAKMRNIGGVQIKDRRYKIKIYAKCFLGSEAVSWIKSTYKLSTKQAVKLGQRLIDKDIIHHVTDDHKFKDESLFYRFYWDEN